MGGLRWFRQERLVASCLLPHAGELIGIVFAFPFVGSQSDRRSGKNRDQSEYTKPALVDMRGHVFVATPPTPSDSLRLFCCFDGSTR